MHLFPQSSYIHRSLPALSRLDRRRQEPAIGDVQSALLEHPGLLLSLPPPPSTFSMMKGVPRWAGGGGKGGSERGTEDQMRFRPGLLETRAWSGNTGQFTQSTSKHHGQNSAAASSSLVELLCRPQSQPRVFLLQTKSVTKPSLDKYGVGVGD